MDSQLENMESGRSTPPRPHSTIIQRKLAAMKAGTFKLEPKEARRSEAAQPQRLEKGRNGASDEERSKSSRVRTARPRMPLRVRRHLLHSASPGAGTAIPTPQDPGQGVLDSLYSANGFDFDFSDKAYSDEFKDLGKPIHRGYNDSINHENLAIDLTRVSISRETENAIEKEATPGHGDVQVPEWFVHLQVASFFLSAVKVFHGEMTPFTPTTKLEAPSPTTFWERMKRTRHWFDTGLPTQAMKRWPPRPPKFMPKLC